MTWLVLCDALRISVVVFYLTCVAFAPQVARALFIPWVVLVSLCMVYDSWQRLRHYRRGRRG